MLQGLKRLLRRYDRSLLAAAAVSGLFFLYACVEFLRRGQLQVAVFLRFGVGALVLFLLVFGIIRAMLREIRRDMEAEADGAHLVDERLLFLFAATKAVVRTCLGVSLTLLWFAGLFYIFETYRDFAAAAAVLLAGAFSAVMLGLAGLLVFVLDRLRFPAE